MKLYLRALGLSHVQLAAAYSLPGSLFKSLCTLAIMANTVYLGVAADNAVRASSLDLFGRHELLSSSRHVQAEEGAAPVPWFHARQASCSALDIFGVEEGFGLPHGPRLRPHPGQGGFQCRPNA